MVVGSGAGGGMFARTLTEGGANVLVIEAGGHNIDRDIRHHQWPWDFPQRDVYIPDAEYAVRLPTVQHVVGQEDRQATTVFDGNAHRTYYNDHFWAKRRDWKYTFPNEMPYRWVRVRAIGGKTNCWDANTGRCGQYIWKPASYDGFDVDWPIDYDEMAPWYAKTERMIGVSGPDTKSVDFPRGEWLPPVAMRCSEKRIIAAARKLGWNAFPEPKAALTRDFKGRPACHYCGNCGHGCDPGSKFTSVGVMIPAARATGRLTMRPNSIVREVLTDAQGRARGVSYVDRYTFKEGEALGHVVVLAASPIETARIMLNSKSARFPDGIANSSGQLGRNLVENVTASVHGIFHDFRNRPVANEDGWGTGGMISPLVNTNPSNRSNKFLRSYTFNFSGAFGMTAGAPRGEALFGSGFKRESKVEYGWNVSVAGSGEVIRSDNNFVEIDPDVRDAWGIPAARIRLAYGENERAMANDIVARGIRLLEAAGAEVVGWAASPSIPGGQITEQGTCRMGNDPRKFVTNRWGHCHDVPNLVIGDGAINVTPASQNPTLTIMALAMRNANHLIEATRRGDLR